jgi:hypothetical protein
MMEPIFHDGKKKLCWWSKLRDWTKWFVAIHSVLEERYNAFTTWFSFSFNKKQKKLQS